MSDFKQRLYYLIWRFIHWIDARWRTKNIFTLSAALCYVHHAYVIYMNMSMICRPTIVYLQLYYFFARINSMHISKLCVESLTCSLLTFNKCVYCFGILLVFGPLSWLDRKPLALFTYIYTLRTVLFFITIFSLGLGPIDRYFCVHEMMTTFPSMI